MSSNGAPRLDGIQAAIDDGEIERARRLLLELDEEEQRLLREELGEEAFSRLGAAARRAPRGKLGKVVLLPGIMGSELDAVDAKGDADRIWLNFPRLIAGRIRDLELAPDGSPKTRGLNVRPVGLHRKTYLPMLVELDTQWHVRPFPFDWREDIDKSADRLAAELETFGGGDPVHLVAHSMGGLVSRRLIQRHGELWRSLDDGTGKGRGGRLVMLGTPNRGSFAIPLTLTGAELLIQVLAKADLRHSLPRLLRIVAGFPGLYQMLPSPLVDLDGDDHGRLFDPTTWGDVQASAPLLERAHAFIQELDEVTDRQRLLYVAGYNQPTPVGIRVERPGRFSYRRTLAGDGRVPHDLGLLDGVVTYWVDELHGNLAKNTRVLDAITELLEQGTTSRLPTAKPRDSRRGRAVEEWVADDEIEPVPPAVATVLAGARARSAGDEPEPTREDAIRLENLGAAAYLGSGAAAQTAADDSGVGRSLEPVSIEVVWGDITREVGDVYAVGHYEGVEPQYAELALDRAVSGLGPEDEDDPGRLLITQHTRRGMLRGALGDVSFFPWGATDNPGRLVAVAGMGRPGTFDRNALRRLVRTLVLAISALPRTTTICSVLIGSGEGTLTITDSVRGLVDGIAEAAEKIAASDDMRFVAPVERLLIVELDRGRAEEIVEALRLVAKEQRRERDDGRPPAVALKTRLRTTRHGAVSLEESVALLAESAIALAGASSGAGPPRGLASLLDGIPAPRRVQKLALDELRRAGGKTAERRRRPRFQVAPRGGPGPGEVPTRVSFWNDGAAIRAAAIHEAATVPERLVPVANDVVDDLVEKMTDPPADRVDEFCRLLLRLLVPREFREVLDTGPFVFEVDRAMARVHWEMLAADVRDEAGRKPLAVEEPFARQLRTLYSPPPLPPLHRRERLRALVVGDPGDPAKREDLPGARSEAIAVVELLEARGVQVDARIGAPSVPRDGPLARFDPADRLEVLALLLEGGYDLLHYAGHGDFDPVDPRRAGWLFANGLLTGGEIGRIEHVPDIVVANACLSARTSHALAGQRQPGDVRSEAGLLPSLADEFFRIGVRNYVGTAWEVNDIGAELFAEVFYASLLPEDGGQGDPFGESIRKARETLWERRRNFGPLWAAYQHYGDPTIYARVEAPAAADGRPA